MAFCLWLLSLSTVFSRFICVVVCISTSFFLCLNDIPLTNMERPYFVYLRTSWWTFKFYILAIMNRLLKTFMYRFFCVNQYFKSMSKWVNGWWLIFQHVFSGQDMNYNLYFFWAGLGRVVQAEEYLSQAQWTVLKSTECSYAIHSLLHRNLGLLYMAKENYEEARYHLANDVNKLNSDTWMYLRTPLFGCCLLLFSFYWAFLWNFLFRTICLVDY